MAESRETPSPEPLALLHTLSEREKRKWQIPFAENALRLRIADFLDPSSRALLVKELNDHLYGRVEARQYFQPQSTAFLYEGFYTWHDSGDLFLVAGEVYESGQPPKGSGKALFHKIVCTGEWVRTICNGIEDVFRREMHIPVRIAKDLRWPDDCIYVSDEVHRRLAARTGSVIVKIYKLFGKVPWKASDHTHEALRVVDEHVARCLGILQEFLLRLNGELKKEAAKLRERINGLREHEELQQPAETTQESRLCRTITILTMVDTPVRFITGETMVVIAKKGTVILVTDGRKTVQYALASCAFADEVEIPGCKLSFDPNKEALIVQSTEGPFSVEHAEEGVTLD